MILAEKTKLKGEKERTEKKDEVKMRIGRTRLIEENEGLIRAKERLKEHPGCPANNRSFSSNN